MISLREPLIAPLAAIAAGILVSRCVSFEIRELLPALAALALLTLVAWRRSTRRAAQVCLLAALTFAGALIATAHRPPPPPELDATFGETVVLAGCVVSPPALDESRQQFLLELEPGARARVNLYLGEGEPPPPLRYGQKVELEARVRRPRNFGNPGAFDYTSFLARQDVYWNASATAGRSLRVLPGACGSRFWAVIFALQTRALDRLDELYRDDAYARGMMRAILIGESSHIEKIWTEHFRRTGTYHALVISGLHVTVLAGFLLLLLRLCAVGELPALALTAAAAWLYALVAGWQAPVVRAAGGFTLYLVGRFFYRRSRVLNLLAAVAIAYLVLDPGQLFDASFQLSFLSVAAIGALAVPLLEATSSPLARGLAALGNRERDPRLEPRVAQFRVELRLLAETAALWTRTRQRRWLALLAGLLRGSFYVFEMVVISAVVQVGLALPMIVYFHRVSLTGLTANVVVVPLLAAVVPLGFVAVFAGWRWTAQLAHGFLLLSEKVVDWHVRWEPPWRVPDPPLWLALAFVAALLALPLALRRGRTWGAPVAIVTLALFAVMLWHPFPARIERGSLEVTAIDVGEGDSLFVATPRGKLMLVDGGGIVRYSNRSRPRLDIGEDVVSPYLWSRSIRRVDVITFSHPDDDHIGGLGALLENFRPLELWVGITGDTPTWTALREKAVGLGVRIVPITAGRSLDFGGARIDALATDERSRKNDSLVLRLSYGRHSYLLTGDAEHNLETELVLRGAIPRTDVLKVAHHGSKTSTTDLFLEAARPAFAVISVGFENSYRHPHPDVIRRLQERHAEILRTDRLGFVSVRTDGRRFRVETNRWSGRGAVSLPVLPPNSF